MVVGGTKVAARVVATCAMVMVLSACPPEGGGGTGTTTSTTIGPDTGPPVIDSFTATRPTGAAPLTTALRWTISDPDAGPLTCSIDLDGGGDDLTVGSCTSASVRSATFDVAGAQTVTLSVSDGTSSVSSSLVVTPSAPSADEYAVDVRLNGTMTPSQTAAFTDAAARWAEVIRTGLPSVTVNVAAGACGSGGPAFSGSVDDLTIDAIVTPIDGVGGTLGSAGPCIVRTTGGLPAYGVMRFDSADLVGMEADGVLDDVILHEMGHIMGVGTRWSAFSLLNGSGTSNPTFTGIVARGPWNALDGGTTPVPVEGTGGSGTANAHWRESTFNNELMTGWVDNGSNPLSEITVGSLADLGYGVDLGAADPYGLPGLLAPGGRTDPGRQLHTELLAPIGTA